MATMASRNRAEPGHARTYRNIVSQGAAFQQGHRVGWHGQVRLHQLSQMQLDRGSEPDETCNQKSLAGALTCFAGRIAGAVVGPATAQKERSD